MRPSATRTMVVVVIAGALALTGCRAPEARPQPTGSATPVSERGPGLKRMNLADLSLPVPRTFDLTHVTPAAFAHALGKDVTRIFEFVRDAIAFEVYPGVLRGPRGTLLAMGGNSADRATLLASLLTVSGLQVRYARGTLAESDARELVASMWAIAPTTSVPATASDAARAAAQAFVKLGKRENARIRDALKGAGLPGGTAAPTVDTLVQETRPHYWVQLARDGGWTDLDPSFADSTIGRTYARAEETLESLPPDLYHRVTVRITAEESDGTQSRTEELVTSAFNAADLSGVSMLLAHVPENWQGPVRNIQGALSAALSETGRIRPVLLIAGQQPIIGAAFPVAVKTTGLGGIGGLLGGQGTRRPVELTTAERIEFTFASPNGASEKAVREVFDLVGPARRARGEVLTQAEITALAGGERTEFLKTSVWNILITTGRLDAAHLAGLPAAAAPQAQGPVGSAAVLQRLGISFQLVSDALFGRLTARDGTVLRVYPDAPRVLITEFSVHGTEVRLAIDLRRDHVRIATGVPAERSAAAAAVLHGVIDGTLERILVDYVVAQRSRTVDLSAQLSTSLLFEQADSAGIPAALVTGEHGRMDPAIPGDALARLVDDLRQGNYALAPRRPIEVAGALRYAWWRINPRTGETTAVTDEGLYSASVDYALVAEQEEGKYDVVLVSNGVPTTVAEGEGFMAAASLVEQLLAAGIEVIEFPF